MEIVRVNFNMGNPVVVPDDKLQNKGKRYYFADAYQLNRDEVFVSPFDLNVERGEVEKPLKPMIRFGTPLFDKDGEKQGIVLLNFFGKYLLTHFNPQSKPVFAPLFLLNSRGFWLKGEQPEQEWGFMYENGNNNRFDVDFPEEWKEISLNQTGQWITKAGMFTFKSVYPFSDALKSSTGSRVPFAPSAGYLTGESYHWKIVSFVPADHLNAASISNFRNLIILDMFFLAILTGGFFILVNKIFRHKLAENEVIKANQELEKRVALCTVELTEANHILSLEFQERLQAESALRESEEKFRSMMESMNDLVYICSKDFKVEYMNPSMIKVIGRNAVGEPCYTALHNSNQICPDCVHARVMHGESPESDVVFPINYRNYRVSNLPISHEDGTVSKMTIFRDTTDYLIARSEKEKVERELRQAQKLESIGTLAGGIAHDFNNILSSILGYTELALEDVEKNSVVENNLQEVYNAGNRAKNLVKQILAFARQSGDEIKPIQVDVITKEVLKLIRSSIPTTIEIKQTIESNALVMGNSTQIHQILMNLCTNAAHAMEEEGGILEVGLKDAFIDKNNMIKNLELRPGNYLEMKVSDTGVGISENDIESIFEPYFTTKGPGEGTGMGLAMVYGIIETYGGTISVDSNFGQGTVFTIYLPTTKRSKELRPYESGDLPCGSERILLVDDEAPIANIGSQVLKRLGYNVSIRTSSLEALELFSSKPNDFDLVITDMTMPNMTGDILSKEMMDIRPDIPIILCTGYSKRISEGRVNDIGIKAFAYKPFVKADLAKTVRKVLDGNHVRKKIRRILVIDDEPGMLKLFTNKLAGKGYEILEAANGKQGLEIYHKSLPDLVITDIVMPEKEGIETITELKKQFPDVKIIAMSGGGRTGPEDYLFMAKRLGAMQTFAKPIDWAKLLMAIEEILS
jgi:signal transduction histidine kinase/CheY-like chemotaxis protein/PAS domain-containing protein